MKRRDLLLGLGVAITAAAVISPVSDAALVRAAVEPGVSPAFVVRVDTRKLGRSSVLVRTVKLHGTAGGAVRVDCPRRCRRTRSAAPRITHRRGDTTVRRLNVRLRGSLTLRFRVIVPSGTSRYLELGVRRGKLRVVTAGCLGAGGRKAACPAPPAPPAPVTDPVPPAPIVQEATPTPTPTATPVATPVPGANPRGALTYVQRLDAGRIELAGWARDADNDNAPLTVRALIDGSPAGQAIANRSWGAGVGPHGFEFTAVTDESRHTVCVVGVNILGGRDTQVGSCRTFAAYADLDGNGTVGCNDKDILLAHYDQNAGYTGGDLNADGIVNIFDLSILLSRFNSGENCPSD
jgi:hypothetical protein